MKIVVMGAGGVGGLYGGRLAHAGCDVTFIARGAQLAALRARGLTIESEALGSVHLPRVKATDDPNDAAGADLVIIAVKLWAMDAAIEAVRPLVGPRTAVLSLQNGVVKDDILKREFGAPAVIGGVAYVAAHLVAPGLIRQTGTLQRVALGEYDGRRTHRVQVLAEAFARAGVQIEVSPDIRRTLWEKFVFLVGLSATTATMRMPIGPIRSNPQTRAFLLEILRETVAVGRALGVALPESYAEERLAFTDSVPADMTSSMHHDLERGKPLEVEWLSGSVVTLGARVGVPTPANRAVWDILTLHARGRRT